ncbi:hypothetical protein HYR99_32570 [Candidatus Poribacteria bacterium]|nr:hypothetical protein [Candidatus Poribacteria bacterium]
MMIENQQQLSEKSPLRFSTFLKEGWKAGIGTGPVGALGGLLIGALIGMGYFLSCSHTDGLKPRSQD